MKKFLICLVLLLVLPLNQYAVFFKHIGVKDGLSQLSVHSIYQDKLGRMWFGTIEGLSIYNGKTLLSYKDNNHIPEIKSKCSFISPITGNKEGDVFYLADDNLIRYDLQKNNFQYIRSGIRNIAAIKGIVYALSADSILYWNNHSRELVFYKKNVAGKNIHSFLIDSNDKSWTGTRTGLYMEDESAEYKIILPEQNITCLFESSTKDIWVGTMNSGIFQINQNGNIVQYLHDSKNSNTISHNYIRSFEEDNYGNLWIGTFDGLNKYNPADKTFTVYKQDNLKGSLTHSSIFSLFKDKQNILWIGTYYGGVNYFDSQRDAFRYYSVNSKRNDCLNFPFISNMVEDKRGNLWICTEGGGLNMLNRESRTFKYITADPSGSHNSAKRDNFLAHNNLKSICYDTDNDKLYIAAYRGGLSSLDINSGKIINYKDFAPPGSLHQNISCVKNFDDYIIFLDDNGLFKLKKGTHEISNLFPNNNGYLRGSTFIIDSKNYLWLTGGLSTIRISLDDPQDKKVFQHGKHGLAFVSILSIIETRNGNIYLSTEGAGIYRHDLGSDSFINFTADEGKIQSNFCYSLTESPNGNIIISSDKGVCIFDDENEVLLFSAEIDKDLPFTAINNGCGMYTSSDGEIFVGSADGLISFFEEDFTTLDNTYNLYFSDITINHTRVVSAERKSILTNILAYTNEINLTHKQNNLIFSFANNNYLKSSNSSLYEYMLKGFDTHWITTNQTELTYTNLSPGKYTLQVRENAFVHNNSKEIQLDLYIRPPFYNTVWAWSIYITTFILLLYAYLAFKQRQIRLHASLEYERKEKERITSLNKTKLSFFTNISHELRTPISLLIARIEMLLEDKTVPTAIHGKIQKLYKNTSYIISLINELLDFQKLDQGQIYMNVSQQNIVSFMHEIFSIFEEKAKTLHIRYSFQPQEDPIICWFDPQQIRKVLYNLLSNAFKFTPTNGFIELMVQIENDSIVIKVADNGIGIDKKELENIFEYFYQAPNNTALHRNDYGTGLGLAVSKEIVELHHGHISVESKLEYGTIFKVILKTGYAHFIADPTVKIEKMKADKDITKSVVSNINLTRNMLSTENPVTPKNTDNPYTLLLVEDNEELLDVLTSLFSPFYRIIISHDGEEGLQMAQTNNPDIIISDVMMPKLNGDLMCIKLKQHIETCHIPIILLTAQISPEKNVEGLQKGADDYITKPFNTRVLLAKCNSLMRNRLLLQQKYKNEPTSTIQLLANNVIDKKFLDQVNAVIEKHLDNTEFSIEILSSELSISRRSFYTKFKQLTGMTPNDFVLDYKLKKAAKLLITRDDLSLSDISDALGFSSSHYFSKCFKIHFKESPMVYKRRHKA